MPIGQQAGVTSGASDCSISFNRSNVSPPSVEPAGKGDYWHVAPPADFENLANLLLDALGGIEHHHRACARSGRRQRAAVCPFGLGQTKLFPLGAERP
jgi:hypothetical protein